jgi:Zn-dependent protease
MCTEAGALDERASVLHSISMSRRFLIGTVFGFPIRVHVSFLMLLAAVLLFRGGVPGVFVALIVAGSVLVHELGHALVARHLGVPVRGIGLHFFGGAAQMELPRNAGDEIAIAAAGPAVSFALAGVGHMLAAQTGLGFFGLFAAVNLVLALFNLLPAFPSDGGRILRALLARRYDFVRATDLAVKVGHVVCVAIAVAGLFLGALQLVAVAIVLWTFGSVERRSTRARGDRNWPGSTVLPDPRVEYTPPHGLRGAGTFSTERPVVFVWRR